MGYKHKPSPPKSIRDFVVESTETEDVFEVEWVEEPTEPTLQAVQPSKEIDTGDGFDDLLELLDVIEEHETTHTAPVQTNRTSVDAEPAVVDEVQSTHSEEDEPEEILDESEDEPIDEAAFSEESANYRKIFETQLHPKPADERIDLAGKVSGAELLALCFDPDVRVIQAIFHNSHVGLQHARLIANHHRNGAGLDALGQMARFLRDGQVRRFLYRNVQTSEILLRKIMRMLPLIQIFNLTRSGENAERTKKVSRLMLREKFQSSSGEQKAGFIFRTEGRCLSLLVGLGFDGKTTALLCRRTFNSSMLIQNLLRFPGTPPQLVKHISRQQLVRRAPHLKKLVLQHSNCPSDVKRSLK